MDTDTWRGEAYVKMEAEGGVMHLQAKDSANQQKLEEAKRNLPLETMKTSQPADILSLDFWLSRSWKIKFPLF